MAKIEEKKPPTMSPWFLPFVFHFFDLPLSFFLLSLDFLNFLICLLLLFSEFFGKFLLRFLTFDLCVLLHHFVVLLDCLPLFLNFLVQLTSKRFLHFPSSSRFDTVK